MSDELQEQVPTVVPVFPLPGVVLFPRAVLPLHIFEPRYREMVADALISEKCVAVALLKPDFEQLYYTSRAPIHPVLGVGRIIAAEQLDDGNYNLLLRGEARARIVEEVPGRAYRQARVEQIDSTGCLSQDESAEIRTKIRKLLREEHVADGRLVEHWLELLDSSLVLGQLVDLIASGLPVVAELRQILLEEAAVEARARSLVEHLETLGVVARQKRRREDGECSRN